MSITSMFPIGGGSNSTTNTTSGTTSPFAGLLQQFLPPSPTDIMKTVLLVVGCVTGALLIVGIVYLLTRRGKGARNA